MKSQSTIFSDFTTCVTVQQRILQADEVHAIRFACRLWASVSYGLDFHHDTCEHGGEVISCLGPILSRLPVSKKPFSITLWDTGQCINNQGSLDNDCTGWGLVNSTWYSLDALPVMVLRPVCTFTAVGNTPKMMFICLTWQNKCSKYRRTPTHFLLEFTKCWLEVSFVC